MSSADWMPRNFERRVEVMFPVEAEDLRRRIVEEIIPTYLSDNRRMRDAAAGRHVRAVAAAGNGRRIAARSSCWRWPRRATAAGREAAGAAVVRSRFMDLAAGNGEAARDRAKRKKKKSSSAK